MKVVIKRFARPIAIAALLAIAASSPAWAQLAGGISDGTVHLRFNHDVSQGSRLNVSGALPGDRGGHAYPLENVGKLPGNLSVSIPEIKNIAATSGPHVDGRGDLGAELQVAFYVDMDGDGMWSAGDVGLAADCSTYMAQSLQYAPLDKYGAVTWLNAVVMEGGRQCTLILLWRIPIAAGNEIQGDSVSFDIKFNLAQYLQ